jgi:hypothetical protein
VKIRVEIEGRIEIKVNIEIIKGIKENKRSSLYIK